MLLSHLRPTISSSIPVRDTEIMSEPPNMSAPTKELLKKVRMIVPPMLEKFHKGNAGVPFTLQMLLT